MQTFIARVGGATAAAPPKPCPFLPWAYISRPKRTEILTARNLNGLTGIAASPSGVARIDILLDDRVVSQGRLGLNPQAHPTPAALAFDPDYPRLRFAYTLPKTALTPGAHRLSILVTNRDGSQTRGEARTVYVPG
jgi:hypothetical protein